MSSIKEERTIFAFKLHSKSNPDQGNIRPVAEVIENKLIELNANNFCHTNKVFVTSGYQANIDDKFKENQIFRVTVNQSEYKSENVDPYAACKYITQGNRVEKLKPSELIQIVDGDLPDRNNRYFNSEIVPCTEYIFIRSKNGECFGPFSWEKDDDLGLNLELLNDKPLLKYYNISLGQIFKINIENFNKYSFDCLVDNKTYSFILNIHDFINSREDYDYASDEEIIRHCAKVASEIGTTSLNKNNWDSFKKIANANVKFSKGLNKARLIQLSKLTYDIFDSQNDIQENLEQYLKSGNGNKLIQDFIERKRPQLLEDIRKTVINEKNKDIEDKEDKVFQIESNLKEKEKLLKELSAEIERKRKEANQEVILESAIAERNQKIKQLDSLLSEKEKQFNEIIEKLNLPTDLNEVYEEIKKQQHIRDFIKSENDSLNETKKKLKIECDKTDDELRSKLISLKPYIESINGSFISNKEQGRSIFIKTNPSVYSDFLEQQQLVIETVKYNLRLKNRYFESWQIANFLISTQQSFITFFAGLPGVGKTSLARLIAESQNLTPRLQEISVARGWTSQKDLIGFYNPLSNRFQSSNTGLYDFIDALCNERKDEQAMAYILLDEANLSPIEHYWSAFMGMTDGEGDRILRLGQDTLVVPTALRFLATINYDGTTEPLSPRVVDRAPVLVMEPSDTLIENNDAPIENRITLPLSASDMDKLFGVTKNIPVFQDDEAVIFNKIQQILSNPSLEKGRPISISQRKKNVIQQYCTQASSLMRFLGCEDDFKALDLAILQHILPQVRGNGHKFARRLTELKQVCADEGLKDSADYLEKMLAYGENELHSYDFFCW